MTQGHFIMENHARIEIPAWQDEKCFVPSAFPHWGAQQEPSHKLSHAKQALPWKKAPWDKVILDLTNKIVGLSTKPDWSENTQKTCYISKD